MATDNALIPATPTHGEPALIAALPVPLRRALQTPLVRRSLPALGMLGAVLAAFLIWSAVSAPGQRVLFPGLGDADKAAAAAALDSASIAYAFDDSGALTVGGGDYHRARLLLAGQGLPKSAPDAGASLDTMPMGASHAIEDERLRGARELDLARTIEAIDAVDSAKVHLAITAPSLFVRDEARPTASVMVTLARGRTLSDAQVQAIVHLVAASVSGLNADAVSVADQAGHLLSTDLSDPVAAEAARQVEVQARIEARYRDALARLLTPMVGADGYTAEVHADLNFDEKQATRESYPETDRAVRQEQSRWTSANGAPPAIGIPGALSNTPPEPATLSTTPPPAAAPSAAPGTTPGRTSEDLTRDFALGREVSVARTATGTVRRLTVAVALRDGAKKRAASDVAAIDALVRGAIGFDQGRGDSVTVSSRPFVATNAPVARWWEADWLIGAGRNLAAAAIALALIFGLIRPWIRRRAAEAAARRDEIAGLIGEELGQTPADVTIDMIEATPSYAERVAMIRDFVRANPSRAAMVVRELVQESEDD